jgi:hypothetical protein
VFLFFVFSDNLQPREGKSIALGGWEGQSAAISETQQLFALVWRSVWKEFGSFAKRGEEAENKGRDTKDGVLGLGAVLRLFCGRVAVPPSFRRTRTWNLASLFFRRKLARSTSKKKKTEHKAEGEKEKKAKRCLTTNQITWKKRRKLPRPIFLKVPTKKKSPFVLFYFVFPLNFSFSPQTQTKTFWNS